jgi:hypothetical protein
MKFLIDLEGLGIEMGRFTVFRRGAAEDWKNLL